MKSHYQACQIFIQFWCSNRVGEDSIKTLLNVYNQLGLEKSNPHTQAQVRSELLLKPYL